MYEGNVTIKWLYETLKVDDQWSIFRKNGFTWWCSTYAQSADIDGIIDGPDGDVGYKVVIKTDFLKNITLSDKNAAILNQMMMKASLCAPVYDAKTSCIKLVSQVDIHDGIEGWMHTILGISSLNQLYEVERLAPKLAKMVGAEIAASGHPKNGIRTEPDEILSAVDNLIIPDGKNPSKWPDSEYTYTVNQYMQQPLSVGATSGGKGLTGEFPQGDRTSLLHINGDESHPLYGNGLTLLQKFMYRAKPDGAGCKDALLLNSRIVAEDTSTYGLGSFCYTDGLLVFNSFIPNLIYKPGYLVNLYYSSAARAQAVNKWLGIAPWTRETFANKKSVFERFYEMFQ